MTLVISILYLPSNTEEAYCHIWSGGVSRFRRTNLCSDCFNQQKTEEFAEDLADGESRPVFLKLFDGDLTYTKGGTDKDETCTAKDVLMVKVWTCTKVKGQEIECKLDEEETGKRCTISFKKEIKLWEEPFIERDCMDADFCNDPHSKKSIFEWNHICTKSCCPEDNKDGPLRASLTLKERQSPKNVVLISEKPTETYAWNENLSPNKEIPRFSCYAEEGMVIKYFWSCSNLQNDWTIQDSPRCDKTELNKNCVVRWDAKTGLLTDYKKCV